jgi:hypothetical protein
MASPLQSESARASNTVFTDDAVLTDDELYAFEEQLQALLRSNSTSVSKLIVLPLSMSIMSTQYDQIMSILDALSQENAQTRGTTAASPDDPILTMERGKPLIRRY